MLTEKQRKLLELIQSRMKKYGVCPSFEEMRTALDLRSKSGIHRMITALEERGFIRRLANRARALEVVRSPNTINLQPAFETSFSSPPLRAGAADETRAINAPHQSAQTVPLIGRIAAGLPIEARDNGPESITVAQSFLSRSGQHYALEVKGDSMVQAGVLDGDIVIIRAQQNANNGDIVVALVDDYEATLKRFYRKDGAIIALEAANPAYETQIYPEDKVAIQGCLAGLIRNY